MAHSGGLRVRWLCIEMYISKPSIHIIIENKQRLRMCMNSEHRTAKEQHTPCSFSVAINRAYR